MIFISEALGMSFEDRVDVVLPTPQSTRGMVGEVLIPMVLARALAHDVAAHDRATAIRTYEQVNELRSAVASGSLDVDVRLPIPSPAPKVKEPTEGPGPGIPAPNPTSPRATSS